MKCVLDLGYLSDDEAHHSAVLFFHHWMEDLKGQDRVLLQVLF